MITVDVKLKQVIIVGDADKLRTVIDNLVSNAIKYSPRAGVIEITLGPQAAHAVLDVVDQGPGIAPADRERVFESFYTGKPPADGKVKGSGLGLAIAREYAHAHGGRIEVLDRADGERGTRFRLWLPLAAGAPRVAADASVGAASGDRGPQMRSGSARRAGPADADHVARRMRDDDPTPGEPHAAGGVGTGGGARRRRCWSSTRRSKPSSRCRRRACRQRCRRPRRGKRR